MPAEFADKLTAEIIDFLRAIGISVVPGPVNDETFLPGIEVVDGGLVVDEAKLLYPGDLLHEAGHLAVTPARQRSALHGMVEITHEEPPVVETAAMCWSYAACIHLGIDPRVVFHEHGYHGRSESLLRNFELGLFLGVQALEDAGMTLSSADAAAVGKQPFPVMQYWLRD